MRATCQNQALVLLMVAAQAAATAAEPIPLRFSEVANQASFTETADGVYDIRTTGDDPYIVCRRLAEPFDPAQFRVLSFEYITPDDLEFFEVFFGNPFNPQDHTAVRGIVAVSEWTPLAADLGSIPRANWRQGVVDFRVDFGPRGGRSLRLRNLCLRPLTDAERAELQRREDEERRRLAESVAKVEATLVAPRSIAATGNVIAATKMLRDAGGTTAISVIGRDLDLGTLLDDAAAGVPPPVPLGPPLVAGQGDSPKNHTLVRVLNRYGICEVQFLAYPPTVRGGVQVDVGNVLGDGPCIVTAPLADAAAREVRVFSRLGQWRASVPLPAGCEAPCALAVGDVLGSGAGDQIVVASRFPREGRVRVYVLDGRGAVRREQTIDAGSSGRLSLAVAPGRGSAPVLLAYVAGQSGFVSVDLASGRVEAMAAGLDPACTGVFPSAAGPGAYTASADTPRFSSIRRVAAGASAVELPVGARENLFWFTTGGPYRDVPEGRHIRRSKFAHIRTDFASPRARDPDFTRTDLDYWAGEEFRNGFVASRLRGYDSDLPTCWEPCFTHRWFYQQAEKWMEARDPETGLPAYVLVDRLNQTGTYGEFGADKSFVSGSYAPDVPATESFYTYPLRVFLHELVQRFRRNPEHFVAVEPNHEMEINPDNRDTHGDYNPNMIRAFYRHLAGLHGSLEAINRVYGTPFTAERFDAPRDLQRGPWDAYDVGNPFYAAWMGFQAHVIYRVIAGTYREALLAGFPPEAIKCHQIPDHYAISSLAAFSRPSRRITPIDWNLTAGVGYGFTRYGVWYNHEHNPVQGAQSSGFDAMVIGEYQSLTPNADLALTQLEYLHGNGVQFIHAMVWPQGHDRGYNAALAAALTRLVEADQPRPGVTGGTGQVRPVRIGGRDCEIVSLGTGREHTGLLKSILADGTWEGTVYVVPFHAHVAVQDMTAESGGGRAVDELAGTALEVRFPEGLPLGNTVDVSFLARADRPSQVSLRLHHGSEPVELADQKLTVVVGTDWAPVRLQVRVHVGTGPLLLTLGSGDADGETWLRQRVAVRDLQVLRLAERTTRLREGVFAGERHEGGVTFAVLPVAE